MIAQALAAMPDLYLDAGREAMIGWFHAADVPGAVVEADTAATLTVVPRRAAAESSTPGITVAAAATVDVPVLLAYGEQDVSPAPHTEPAFFTASPDVTLYVLAGSAHCHNFATTRRQLWDRMAAWYRLLG
jgi:pimeloyl-ACP methyl ester carboxylesterase